MFWKTKQRVSVDDDNETETILDRILDPYVIVHLKIRISLSYFCTFKRLFKTSLEPKLQRRLQCASSGEECIERGRVCDNAFVRSSEYYTNVKSIKKTLFHPAEIKNPTSFLPASSFDGYEATGSSAPLVLRAFPVFSASLTIKEARKLNL